MQELDNIINTVDVRALKDLIETQPALVEADLPWGNSLLSIAVEINSNEMVELLQKHGANPNKVYMRQSPIRANDNRIEIALSKLHSVHVLRTMMSYGAKLDIPNLSVSLVTCAISINKIDVAEALINHGALVNKSELIEIHDSLLEEKSFRDGLPNNEKRIEELSKMIAFCSKYKA